jgi:uncharacterized membrane protein
LWRPFWKWRPVEIFRSQESFRDIIIYPHMKCSWNRTMLNLCGIVVAILKMATGRNFSMSGINIYPHIKFWWYRTMLNICGIVVAILKMATGRNLSMSAINSGYHYLPTYQILLISDNVEFLRYCGGHSLVTKSTSYCITLQQDLDKLGIWDKHEKLNSSRQV